MGKTNQNLVGSYHARSHGRQFPQHTIALCCYFPDIVTLNSNLPPSKWLKSRSELDCFAYDEHRSLSDFCYGRMRGDGRLCEFSAVRRGCVGGDYFRDAVGGELVMAVESR